MSILNVNTIQPVGSGQTITVSAANISAPSTVVTASSFVGNVNATGISTFSDTVNVGAGKSIRIFGSASGYSDIIAAAGSASTVFTLPANGGSNGQYLQTNGSGVLSWQPAMTASGPAFRAYRATSQQSYTNLAWTKVQFNAELFDTASCFDSTTNYRFTPNVAGYYAFSSTVYVQNTSITYLALEFYKNGSYTNAGSNYSAPYSANNAFTSASDILYANGTTDYFEVYIQSSGAAGPVVQNSDASWTYFAGALIRPA